jgi:hypothetical protein
MAHAARASEDGLDRGIQRLDDTEADGMSVTRAFGSAKSILSVRMPQCRQRTRRCAYNRVAIPPVLPCCWQFKRRRHRMVRCQQAPRNTSPRRPRYTGSQHSRIGKACFDLQQPVFIRYH